MARPTTPRRADGSHLYGETRSLADPGRAWYSAQAASKAAKTPGCSNSARPSPPPAPTH